VFSGCRCCRRPMPTVVLEKPRLKMRGDMDALELSASFQI
jgi:hypothetical protein